MRKRTDMDDSNQKPTSEAQASGPRRLEPRDQDASPSPRPVACSSFTLPINSQIKIRNNQWESLSGTAGIDWFQLAACIDWNSAVSEKAFQRLRQAKEVAQEHRSPATLTIGPDTISVTGSGSGGGRDSHKEIQLIWKNVRVGLSEREKPTRQLNNGSLQVSGEPCLVTGAGIAWEFFTRLVTNLGGRVTDEWIRRLDVCIDIPDLNFSRSVYPLLYSDNVNTRCRESKYYRANKLFTGYCVGNSARLRVLIYDKVRDCLMNHDSVYTAAMIQRRWGNKYPEQATRVEWQMGRAWLKQFGLDNARQTMQRMPDVFSKLTDDVGGAFRITQGKPDRANQHQSRAATHPMWSRIVSIGRDKIGESEKPLKRLDRSNLDESRAIMQIIGLVTSIADRRQTICETKADVGRLIDETMENHQIEDAMIQERFMKKAKASGTWQEIFSFPGKEAA